MLSADNLPDQTQHNVGPDQDLNCLTPISADGIEKFKHPKNKIWQNKKV